MHPRREAGERGEVIVGRRRCEALSLERPLPRELGRGESIVSGTVTPDTVIVGKADRAVHARTIAEKRRMTVAVPGGTRDVGVPRLLRTQPALTDRQIGAMAALAAALETTMGWPVDVECAFHGDRLYLLQCRPITTLTAVRPPSPLVPPGARAGQTMA